MSAPTSNNPLSYEDRKALEATHTWQRIVELRLHPVDGNFDAHHLKEINRRVFQDLPALGFTELTPGEFRPAVPAGRDWHKTRNLDTVRVPLHVAYSSMNSESLTRLDSILSSARPDGLASLKTKDFAAAIGNLYAELDYIHPFIDGNSRTLREFTRQLADVAGYNVDWERFTTSPAGRDLLYVARDRSVNTLALPHVQDRAILRNITLSLDQFSNNPDMQALMLDAVRPHRAIAFERSKQDEALRAHPDLAQAYQTMAAAKDHFAQAMPKDAAARQAALDAVRQHVQTRLDEGETRDFRHRDPLQQQKHMPLQNFSREADPAADRGPPPDLER